MEEIVEAKFKQNPEVAFLLLETGDEVLIEGNKWGDVYWGCVKDRSVLGEWKGSNHLGRILMKVRSSLRAEKG